MTREEEPGFPREIERAIIEALPAPRRAVTKQFIQNCLRTFNNISEDPTASLWWMTGSKTFGDNWLKYLLSALIEGFNATPLFDICDFRAATSPVQDVELRFRVPIERGIALRTVQEQCYMITRRTRWWHPIEAGIAKHGQIDLWITFVREIFGHLTTEVITSVYAARLHEQSNVRDFSASKLDLAVAIEGQSADMERTIGLAPNNLLVGVGAAAVLPFEPLPNYEPKTGFHLVGRLHDRWNVFFDPQFFEEDLLLWHHTSGGQDAGFTMMPYSIGFTSGFQTATVRYGACLGSIDYYRVGRIT